MWSVVSCCVLLKKEIFENILVNEINDSKKNISKKKRSLVKFYKENSIYSLGESVIRKLIILTYSMQLSNQ